MYRHYDVENISLENLPGMIDYELSQLDKLNSVHASLEMYHLRASDNRLSGKELDKCIDLCNEFTTEHISTEGRMVISNEFIMTTILVAVAAVVAAIIYTIFKAVSLVKRMRKEGISPEEFGRIAQNLDVKKLNGDAVEQIIKTYKANKSGLKSLKDFRSLTKEKAIELGIQDSELPAVLNQYIKILELAGINPDLYDVEDAVNFLDRASKYGFIDALVSITSHNKAKDHERLKAIWRLESYDLEKLIKTLDETSKGIVDSGNVVKSVINGQTGSSYHKAIETLEGVLVKTRNISDQLKTIVVGITDITIDHKNIKFVNSFIASNKSGRLLKETEDIIRTFGKARDPKVAAKEYVEPLVKRLNEIIPQNGNEINEAEVKRYVRAVPAVSAEWVSHYAIYCRDEYRYMSFFKRYGDIVDVLMSKAVK